LHFGAVAGLKVGHFTDARRPTGCTVVLCEAGAVASVDQRGGAPGTRETDLLAPERSVEQVHALLLTGGSAFGLDAAGGVMRWLDERGHGLVVGPARVPIVPAAVLFDLWVGDPSVRPDAAAGYAACEAASADNPAEGSIGAGAGARVGKLWGIGRASPGGIGQAAFSAGGVTVGALVAVNAIGDVVDADGRILAGARSADGSGFVDTAAALRRGEWPPPWVPSPAGSATTIGVVATDAALTKAQCRSLAALAHAGLARAVNPLTPNDGDTLFALATGRRAGPAHLGLLGALAAEAVALAIRRAVAAAAGPASG
jgi:L-aminopeptidase/D-esterase-like protein